IPMWIRRAIFHRDKGECRTCKRSLAAIINQLDTEHYDHIVPLARFGANDVTNLQLLCDALSTAEQKSAIGRRKSRPPCAASGERREGVARPEFPARSVGALMGELWRFFVP